MSFAVLDGIDMVRGLPDVFFDVFGRWEFQGHDEYHAIPAEPLDACGSDVSSPL